MSDLRPKAVRPPLALGNVVEPWGMVAEVRYGHLTGKRYYFLIDDVGCVSMMPAGVVETERNER